MMPYNADYEPTQAGVFEIEWNDYRKIKALNISSAKELKRTPAHFQASLRHPFQATWQMNVGSAFHYLALEPERFEEEIVVAPPLSKNSNKYKEWAAENEGRIILDASHVSNVRAMVAKMQSKASVRLLLSGGWAERTLLWRDPDFGYWCKGRVDFFPEKMPGSIVDLKKTVDAGLWPFRRAIDRYDYNGQAWWYLNGATIATGVRHDQFYWIAWEDQPPHDGNVYRADPREVMEAGDRLYPIRKRYAECLESGEWPGYDDCIIDLGECAVEDLSAFDPEDDIPY